MRAERLIGLAVLAYLLVLAWVFHLERMATQDSAFFSWLVIDTHEPYAALGRISSWLAQLPALIMVWTHAPLDGVLRVYSVSIIGVHVLVFWLVAFRMRDERAAIALPLTLVAATHQMFYFAISELYQGLSVLLLVWALADRCWKATDGKSAWRWGILAFLANIWASLHHQLLVLPLVFLLIYEGIAHARFRQRPFQLLSYVLISWYGVRAGIIPASEYEQGRMPTLAILFEEAGRLGELPSTAHLLSVWPKFKSLLLLVALTGGLLVAQRRWWSLLWSISFSAAFLVLVLVTDRDGSAPTIFENYYPVVAFVWAAVLGDRWGTINMRIATRARWPALVVVLSLGCMQVWRGHHVFTARVDYLDRVTGFLRSNGTPKGYVDARSLPWTYAYGNWPLAFESALVSARYGPEEAATLFCTIEDLRLDTMYHKGNAFLGPNWLPLWFTSDHLNPSYFVFRHHGYVRVNNSLPDSVGAALDPRMIRLRPPVPEIRMVPDRFTVALVDVENGSDRILGSIRPDGTPLRFRYRLYDEAGALYAEHAQSTALEVDIPAGGTYRQGVIIERPLRRGRYRVELELSTDAGGPTGIDTSFWIRAGWF
jgi:hypothetical protein